MNDAAKTVLCDTCHVTHVAVPANWDGSEWACCAACLADEPVSEAWVSADYANDIAIDVAVEEKGAA